MKFIRGHALQRYASDEYDTYFNVLTSVNGQATAVSWEYWCGLFDEPHDALKALRATMPSYQLVERLGEQNLITIPGMTGVQSFAIALFDRLNGAALRRRWVAKGLDVDMGDYVKKLLAEKNSGGVVQVAGYHEWLHYDIVELLKEIERDAANDTNPETDWLSYPA